jgi:hypothetical protein
MKLARHIIIFACAASLLAGCSSLKKLTGQRNDTVLPGEREDILPPDQQVNPRVGEQSGADAANAPCDPTVDSSCASSGGVDQEAPGESSL